MRLHSLKNILSLIFLSWGIFLSAQYYIPEKPNILYPVYDEVGLLSEQEKQQLNQKLIKFEDSTSTEIEVIIIPSTKGEDINFLATKFGQTWQIGKKGVDNGVIFLIATEDRAFSIQQGRAVEQYLTASVAGQILDYIVTPEFRKKQWYQGIDKGTDAIIQALQGKFKPQKQERGSFSWGQLLVILIIFGIFMLLISKSNGRGGRGGGNYTNYDDDVILSRRGRRTYQGGFWGFPTGGSSGGFGGSSGGFGGFGGGGSFGGGGASGGW